MAAAAMPFPSVSLLTVAQLASRPAIVLLDVSVMLERPGMLLPAWLTKSAPMAPNTDVMLCRTASPPGRETHLASEPVPEQLTAEPSASTYCVESPLL